MAARGANMTARDTTPRPAATPPWQDKLDALASAVEALEQRIEAEAIRSQTGHANASGKLDQLARSIEATTRKLDLINTQIWALRDDLPEMISTSIRDALRSPPTH
jgi:hypothetical protein